jgi:pectin methylesterase-like acyl-CoA thioesterase
MKKLALLTAALTTAAVGGARQVQLVDDDGEQRPNAAYTTIQAAVDAAQPGNLDKVCPGTYPEQVVLEGLPKPLRRYWIAT